MYDNVCKRLAETYSQDFARWLLGTAIGLTALDASELSGDPIRADALILLAAPSLILHLEFQTQPDATLPFRMTDYRLRLYRRYPDTASRQVVLYLKPTTSALVYQTCFEIPGLRHEFEVIRLWEVPSEELMQFPGLLPLAVLGQTPDRPQTLRTIAQRIEQLPSQIAQRNAAASTFILAGLVLEKAVIRQILREELVKESVTYQDILEQGLQEGLQQGLQQGRQDGESELVVRQLQRRLGAIAPEYINQIRALACPQLEDLGEALLDFTQLDDLVTWLAAHKS